MSLEITLQLSSSWEEVFALFIINIIIIIIIIFIIIVIIIIKILIINYSILELRIYYNLQNMLTTMWVYW